MLATIGDLVEDVVVRLRSHVNVASDTPATIERRQGGSAANVAAAAVLLGRRGRFIGRVGDDSAGRVLIEDLREHGVDVDRVQTAGRTGTIVVLVDAAGERSMLTDRGAALALDAPDRAWLDGVRVLHVPLYSLSDPPLADTTRTIVAWAHDRGIAVSIDLSSVALIDAVGSGCVRRQLDELRPAVVFANADEAAALAAVSPLGSAITVVKHGPAPVTVFVGTERLEIAVEPIGSVPDTTGAGDAFAAGFLTHGIDDDPVGWAVDPKGAVVSANRAAAAHLASIISPNAG